jgi:pilus assembly protein FimV
VVEEQTEESIAEAMDDDQLEKALQDFEHQELDEVLDSVTSEEDGHSSTLEIDDLEFASLQEPVESGAGQQENASISPLPDLQEIASLADFDDAELEKALDDLDEEDGFSQEPISEKSVTNQQSINAELDDMPGLGDWLNEPNAEQKDEDTALLDELEIANFDELLETIDLADDLDELGDEVIEIEIENDPDSDFDLGALLSESSNVDALGLGENLEESDFLDVDTLLTESIDAESQPLSDKELPLDVSLENFSGVSEDSDTIDVDSDKGMGAKLDLAHAYIEMGEVESARELLDEIVGKGEKEQQEEAMQVLKSLD